jgi:hypothetical protein
VGLQSNSVITQLIDQTNSKLLTHAENSSYPFEVEFPRKCNISWKLVLTLQQNQRFAPDLAPDFSAIFL